MKRGMSPEAGHTGEGWGVPGVAWRQLEGGEVRVLGRGHYAIVYRATLTLQEDQRVAVALKSLIDKPFTSQSIPLEEARVLQALKGLEGVPALHGVTDSPPHVLVMSLCPGFALSVWRRRGEIRACLKAVKELCVILSKMHHRGVTHGDLHGCNVLVNVPGDSETSVWVIDFGSAKRNADAVAMKTDVKQVMKLLRNILMTMEENSDREIYRRRREIVEFMTPDLTLEEISSLVCGVLRDPANETLYSRNKIKPILR